MWLAMLSPVCPFFASGLQDLVQLLHYHGHVDLCAFGKHLGLFLVAANSSIFVDSNFAFCCSEKNLFIISMKIKALRSVLENSTSHSSKEENLPRSLSLPSPEGLLPSPSPNLLPLPRLRPLLLPPLDALSSCPSFSFQISFQVYPCPSS